jgi:hypothetical protein
MTKTEKIILYWEKGYSNKQISDFTGFTEASIRSNLNRIKLKSNKSPLIFEDADLKQFMLGGLLGDLSLCKIEGAVKTSRLSCGHSVSQKDYIDWKSNFLVSRGIKCSTLLYNHYSDRYIKGYCETVFMKSHSNNLFSKYRNIFYMNNIKIVPDITSQINAFGLAIWYMDDGSVTNDSFELNTQNFTYKDCMLLQKILLDNFSIGSNLIKDKRVLEDKGYKLYIPATFSKSFISLIEPFVIPSMKYKLTPYNHRRVLDKSDKLLETPVEDNQQPITNLND